MSLPVAPPPWTDPIPADSNWWEFVPVFDGKQQKQESILRKYVNDWGYGVVAGNVMKRSKHPHCSWAVKHALDEWDDVYSSKGTPPLKPLSKQELEHIEGHSTNAAAAVEEEEDGEEGGGEEGGGEEGGGDAEPDSLNVSAIGQVNESSSRTRPTAKQVLAKGFSPTVAEGLSYARGRDSLGHDPTGRLSYGGVRRGGGGGGTPDPISTEGAWQPTGEKVGLYTTKANKVYPVYREPDGKFYYPNYYGKKQEADERHVAPLENELGEIVGSYKVSFGVDKDEVVAVYKDKSTGKFYRFEGKHGEKRVEVKTYDPPQPYARP